MVGFASCGWPITFAVYSSISMDLPEPWVCQTTPIRPSERTASMVEPTALVTAKYWCGLAMRLVTPEASSSKATKSWRSWPKRSRLNRPFSVQSISVWCSPSGPGSPMATGWPSSSTFQDAKWFQGVNGVPYRELMPSVATTNAAKRNAIGSSATYVCSWLNAASAVAARAPACLSSMIASGSPFT